MGFYLTMNVLICLILIRLMSFTIGQSNFADYGPIPDKCQPRPEILRPHCCIFPPFFTREVAGECGAHFKRMFVHSETNVTGLRRITDVTSDCTYWKCMLQKYFLLDTDGLVKDEKLFNHLDKWVDLNPPFADAILNAKIHCKQVFRAAMPLDSCEFNDFRTCMRNHVTVNCPAVIQSPSCREQKEFYKECHEYFI